MADRFEARRGKLLGIFRAEAEEHLREIGVEIPPLFDDPTGPQAMAHIETLFRVFHTLKGAARSVGVADVEQLCEGTEGLLRDLTTGRSAPSTGIPGLLQEICDALTGLLSGAAGGPRMAALLAAIQAQRQPGAPPPETSAPPAPPVAEVAAPLAPAPAPHEAPPPPPAASAEPAPEAIPEAAPEAPAAAAEIVRVEVTRLDRLVLLSEDLLVRKLASAERTRSALALGDRVKELRAALQVNGAASAVRGAARGADVLNLVQDLRGLESELRRHSQALLADQKAIHASVDELIEETRRVRMTPLANTLAAFPAMIRDLARESGKEVAWSATGTDLLLDRRVLEVVKDPLIHIVRNAVDHGIEPPGQREAAGKPRLGRISVRVFLLDGGRCAIEVADDGKGFSVTNLRDAVVRARLLTPEQVATMDERQVKELAFRAGVSTSPVITRISGNGLGLAIVRERIERIDGRIETESTAGVGTTFRITVPTSIATSRGLQLAAGGKVYLCPTEAVVKTIGMPVARLATALERGVVEHEGETVPFGRLTSILGVRPGAIPQARGEIPCVVVKVGERRGVLAVDEVVGETEVLVKEFPLPLRRVRSFVAAGLMGTGGLILILRPSDLLELIHRKDAAEGDDQGRAEARAMRILVVDDSITTRSMERNMLEAAGYVVRTAVDGADAWASLQADPVDLVVSDVDMPRMNGFELTSKIRASSALADLPVILVTALESREDKERGINVGANAYVLKSGFDQSNLLEIVARLV